MHLYSLEDGLSGLVHVSQISQKRIKFPKDVLNVGDEVQVKVIGVKDGKISLSMKALEEAIAGEQEEVKVEIPKSGRHRNKPWRSFQEHPIIELFIYIVKLKFSVLPRPNILTRYAMATKKEPSRNLYNSVNVSFFDLLLPL